MHGFFSEHQNHFSEQPHSHHRRPKQPQCNDAMTFALHRIETASSYQRDLRIGRLFLPVRRRESRVWNSVGSPATTTPASVSVCVRVCLSVCVCAFASSGHFSAAPRGSDGGDGAFCERRRGLTIEAFLSPRSEAALFRPPPASFFSGQGVKKTEAEKGDICGTTPTAGRPLTQTHLGQTRDLTATRSAFTRRTGKCFESLHLLVSAGRGGKTPAGLTTKSWVVSDLRPTGEMEQLSSLCHWF